MHLPVLGQPNKDKLYAGRCFPLSQSLPTGVHMLGASPTSCQIMWDSSSSHRHRRATFLDVVGLIPCALCLYKMPLLLLALAAASHKLTKPPQTLAEQATGVAMMFCCLTTIFAFLSSMVSIPASPSFISSTFHLETWPLGPSPCALASYSHHRPWRPPCRLFPSRVEGLAMSPSSLRRSHVLGSSNRGHWALFARAGEVLPSAMATSSLFRPADASLSPADLIWTAQFRSNGPGWPVPLRWSIFIKSPLALSY